MMAGLCILPHLLKGKRKDVDHKFVIRVTVSMTIDFTASLRIVKAFVEFGHETSHMKCPSHAEFKT